MKIVGVAVVKLVDSVHLAAVFIDARTTMGKRVEEDGRRWKEYALTICCVVEGSWNARFHIEANLLMALLRWRLCSEILYRGLAKLEQLKAADPLSAPSRWHRGKLISYFEGSMINCRLYIPLAT